MRGPPHPPIVPTRLRRSAAPALLAAAALLGACRLVPRTAAVPEVRTEADLFEVAEEGDGRCAHPGDPDCLTTPLHKRVRALRLRPGMLVTATSHEGTAPRGGHAVRANLFADVAIPLWVQPPEPLPLGFRRWRAQVLDDPDARVWIIGSPPPGLAPAPAAAPALTYAPPPGPLAATSRSRATGPFHEVVAWQAGEGARVPDPRPPGGGPAVGGALGLARDTATPPAPTTPLRSEGITIWIRSPVHGNYEISEARDGASYYVARMDYSVLPPCQLSGAPAPPAPRGRRCGCAGDRGPPPPGPPGAGDTSATASGSGVTWVGTPPVAQPVTVNVMLLYVSQAVPWWIAEADFQRSLIASLEAANDALAVGATQVTLAATSLGLTPDAQAGSGSCSGVCAALAASGTVATSGARFPWIATWRDQSDVRADLVSLLLPGSASDPYVGWADLLPGTTGDPSKAFSVVRSSGLGGLTLPHELAHNFGCCHGWRDADPNCPLAGPDYRHGRRFPDLQFGPWTTLMGYTGGGLERVPGFSSPDARYQGGVMGHATWSDNARMIRELAGEVAGYR